MAKPIKNRIVKGLACLQYADNDIGLVVSNFGGTSTSTAYRISGELCESFFDTAGENASLVVSPSYSAYLYYRRALQIVKISHASRIIGLILGENDDGSYKIAVMGSDKIINFGQEQTIQGVDLTLSVGTDVVSPTEATPVTGRYNFPELITYNGQGSDIAIARVQMSDWSTGSTNVVDNPSDVKLQFHYPRYSGLGMPVFTNGGKYNGSLILGTSPTELQLSTNKDTTLQLGCPISEVVNVPYNSHMFLYDTYTNIFEAWEGDFFAFLQNVYNDIRIQSQTVPVIITEGQRNNLFSRPKLGTTGKYAGYEGKTHAFNFTPFNLILTHSESQALAYLNNGTLPSDAFLYPVDWKNMPSTDGTPSPDEDPSGEPPSGENGDSGIDGTPTTDANPQITTNMLTNNNLYWLQAGQLEAFITWFWQHAGEIIEADDLWNRIRGLYNDLASAIINIRYFPVDPYYIGGVSDTTNIILSSIEMPITGIKKLNKTKLRKRTLGIISIPHKYNAFTDYSPYTSIMLYLPFHGWMELDIDIFVGNKLEVRCIYDHISGTIQYGIYVISKGQEFLVNTVIGKMAVDIPITLQSKNDRDSAIFNNVTNAFGNLLGAGASAVAGNPIGLVMSTAGVASAGTQSAPIKTNGTMGENGAFFLPNKCAYYIKRPSYNRPANYSENVGFPCNQGGKLSDFKGLTIVYNPRITFKGNYYDGDKIGDAGVYGWIKPLEEEIQEIYDALEKGVII